MPVLVLNSSLQPLSVIPERRLIVLLSKQKVSFVDENVRLLIEESIAARRLELERPVIVQLLANVRVPRVALQPTRANILLRDEETCQYCGVSVVPASLDGSQQPFTPLYQPTSHPQSPPASQYKQPVNRDTPANPQDADSETPEASFAEFKHVLWAITFLLSGSVFFLFGTALALFSHNGVLTLQWNGDMWFLYLLVALPLLFFGWRAWSKIE